MYMYILYMYDDRWRTLTPPLRLATEEQVKGLQAVIDDTFQQFALDDSEDEELFSDEGSGFNLTRPLKGHTHSTPELSNTWRITALVFISNVVHAVRFLCPFCCVQ